MRLACTGLLSWFEKKASIVTPSPLLAAVAARQLSLDRLNQGVDSWERPAIYPIEAWLAANWKEVRYSGSEIPTLLSPHQERFLWRSIIEQEEPDLFDLNATARLARRAAKLIAEWHIPVESDLWIDHQDPQRFLRWKAVFDQRCQDRAWITRSDLWRLLPVWIAGGLCNPGLSVFTGFYPSTPALRRIERMLSPLAQMESFSPAKPAAPACAEFCTDLGQQIEKAARWARSIFEQTPERSIGVFIPDLSTNRAIAERVFEQVLYPSRALRSVQTASQTETADSVFHVASAVPLKHDSLVASALLLLELAQPRLDHADASAILRCAFITGASEERGARALADLELRKKRELDVSLRDMELAAKNCPLLAPVWTAIRRVLRTKSEHLEFPKWSEFMGDLLEAVGWPGDSQLDSHEQEVLDKWKDGLSNLATLGLVSNAVSYDRAVFHLKQLLSKGGMERGDWSSPIQILDASQAHGLRFDTAFITGLSDETWPSQLNLNPLVPLKIQRAHQVPVSSPQNIERENNRLTRALFGVAPALAATYSGRLSPLAAPFVTEAGPPYPLWTGNLPKQSYTSVSLEEIQDVTGPPYQEHEGTLGGISIIKSQSLCPFRAFAEFRLAARPPEDACLGFDSRDRGGFVHKALQIVWSHLRTQERLCAASPADLQTIVQAAVVEAVRDDQSSSFHILAGQTECQRLEILILEWLAFERARKQPFTVETVEQQRFYNAPGLRLSLRVDRMDRLKNGKLLLIDYKSGQQSRKKLECPRPPEPQLLVYASAVGAEVDGVFFGEIKPREQRAVGFSREKHFSGSAAEVSKDWGSFLARSGDEIERLAAQFVAGYAVVDPVHNACDYCCLKSLCRVNENLGTEWEAE